MIRMFQLLASNTAVVFSGLYLFSVLSMERYGFLSFRPATFPGVLYSNGVTASATMFLCVLALRLLAWPSGNRGRLAYATLWRGVSVLGVFTVILGLWLGRIAYFEATVRLTEGQDFRGTEEEYVQESIRKGTSASFPELSFLLRTITARFSPDGNRLETLRAETQWYSNQGEGEGEKMELGNLPSLHSRVWLNVEGFGYSPYYRLEDEDGSILDEAFVALALFPPGSEDYFRLLLPHTFYIRYEPSGVLAAVGTSEEDEAARGAVYHLRIARNKDIVFNGSAVPGQKVLFENGSITLEFPRKWVSIRVVRDPGLLLMIVGCGLGLCGLVMGRGVARSVLKGEEK